MKKLWNKYTRNALIILVGLLLGVIGYNWSQSQINTQVHTAKIIVAKANIEPYVAITKDLLQYREVVVSEVPSDAITSPDELDFQDAYASQYGFIQGQPLRSSLITTAAGSNRGGAVALQPGRVHIGIKTDLVMSAGNEVKPGLLVDVAAFVADTQRGTSKTILLPELSGIEVVKTLNSEGKIPDGSEGGSAYPAVVVVDVSKKQAAKIMEYQETGKVYVLPSGVAQP
ncbi:Flp pilus assembly protein CpaB [Paenibacillus graminis]|uniref:Flp pilus assembly protein CpaB n=1 Tax=Paenibacillus graminis TaxID=189425 RepID=UPI002DBF0294|nr:RcpC/CpaB family pilus assembly protein [Paenibacillus graminis]MEC0167367.1 RcpC/CpaB family pilus assembly protein [Paenibacillus graminis]